MILRHLIAAKADIAKWRACLPWGQHQMRDCTSKAPDMSTEVEKLSIGIGFTTQHSRDNLCRNKTEGKAVAAIAQNGVAIWHIRNRSEGGQTVIALAEGSGPKQTLPQG